MTENQLHRAVWQYLKLCLPRDAFAFHPANGGYALGKRTAGTLKAMGLVAGVPDICIIHDGRFYGLELKAPGTLQGNRMVGRGYCSKEQRDCHARLSEAGAEVVTAWTLDDVQHALQGWGIVRRKAA